MVECGFCLGDTTEGEDFCSPVCHAHLRAGAKMEDKRTQYEALFEPPLETDDDDDDVSGDGTLKLEW